MPIPAEFLLWLRARKCIAVPFGVLAFAFLLIGCGGSSAPGGGGGGCTSCGTGPTPDFSLTLSSSSATIPWTGSSSITVSVAGSNGFSGTVSVQLSGMASGISVSPSSAQVTTGGTPASFTITASANAITGNSTITFTGTSGSLTHSTQLAITLQPPPATSALGRTKYVRTDSVTDYGLWLDEGWAVYDPNTQRFFISDMGSNLLRVMDAKTEKQIAAIPVPGVFGIDITPDHSLIYAGTQIGDVYAIDPVGMKVMHRYLSAQIGTAGFLAYAVRVLANGSLALLGGQGGIPSVDGYSSVAVWNIQTNSVQLYTTGYGYGIGLGQFSVEPVTNICPSGGAIGEFLVSGDRQRIIISSIDSDATICSFDPTTGNSNAVTGSRAFIYKLVPTPDGASVVTTSYNPNQIVILDAKTLATKKAFTVAADTSSAGNLLVSPDSSTVYISSSSQILAYDLTTGAAKGWTPAPYVEAAYSGLLTGPADLPTISAMDNTGLIAGPMEEGVGFVDMATMKTGTPGSTFVNTYLTPATGPVGGGTTATWPASTSTSATLSSVYFGTNAATAASKDSSGIHATTPAGNAGPADVYSFFSDGSAQIVPEAFSYGPTILESTPDSSTAEGGGTGIIYGYGFGPAGTKTAPSDLQVSVGGHTVPITAFTSNAYGLASPPFLLEAISFTIPAGTAGTGADIMVTTSSGSTTLSNGMHYLPAIQQFFPPGGPSLAQGIYDPHRDLFYFSDANSIRVFSRANQTWLTSMTLPDSGHRLWAMALSPDGSKLVVSDPPTGSIYLFDPSGAFPPKSFAAKTYLTPNGVEPGGLAVTDSGTVYFGRAVVGTSGASSLSRLDLTSGTVTEFQGVGSSGIDSDVNFHLAVSKDNTRVYFNDEGQMLYIDTATNSVVYKPVGDGCCYGDYDLHMANNQSAIEATSFVYDGDANGEAALALNTREAMNIQYVDGTAFSPDGSLLFQPSTNGIDVFDGRLFTLRTRIALPVPLGQNYDALVSGGPDDQLLAITGANGTGIAIIDLRSLSEPVPLPYLRSTMSTVEPALRLNGSRAAEGTRVPASRVPRRFLLPGQRAVAPEHFQFNPAPQPIERSEDESSTSENGKVLRPTR